MAIRRAVRSSVWCRRNKDASLSPKCAGKSGADSWGVAMKRRDFLTGSAAVAAGALTLPPLGWAQEKSKLKITGIRLVKLTPKHPAPSYTPAPGSWSTQGVEVSAPPNIYPEFRPTRSLFAAKNVPGFTVEITAD